MKVCSTHTQSMTIGSNHGEYSGIVHAHHVCKQTNTVHCVMFVSDPILPFITVISVKSVYCINCTLTENVPGNLNLSEEFFSSKPISEV